MSKQVFRLAHPEARRRALAAVSDAPEGYTVTVAPATRSGEQNALLHALLSEIAASVEWAGKRRDIETWKRLLTAAWLRARGEAIEMLPALDGHGVDIVFRRTSTLTRAECVELVDFVQAWMAENVDTESA